MSSSERRRDSDLWVRVYSYTHTHLLQRLPFVWTFSVTNYESTEGLSCLKHHWGKVKNITSSWKLVKTPRPRSYVKTLSGKLFPLRVLLKAPHQHGTVLRLQVHEETFLEPPQGSMTTKLRQDIVCKALDPLLKFL